MRPRIRSEKGRAWYKKKFLEALEKHHGIIAASAEAGVDRGTILRWRKLDPEFDEACESAQETAIDILVASLYDRALNAKDPETGKRPYDERTAALLSMFLIKGHRPQYKDSFKADIDVGEVRFTFNIPKPEGLGDGARPELPPHDVIEGEVISSD